MQSIMGAGPQQHNFLPCRSSRLQMRFIKCFFFFRLVICLRVQSAHSLGLVVVHPHRLGSHNAWVRAHIHLLRAVGVLVRGHIQTLVVAATVAQHNLRRVLVWHHHAGAGQAGTVGQRVVGLKGFLHHACMQVWSHFENITTHKHAIKH